MIKINLIVKILLRLCVLIIFSQCTSNKLDKKPESGSHVSEAPKPEAKPEAGHAVITEVKPAPVIPPSPPPPPATVETSKAKPGMDLPASSQYKIEITPEFPFPPPVPSSDEDLSKYFLNIATNLKDVDSILSTALDKNKYSRKRYLYVPNGFALVEYTVRALIYEFRKLENEEKATIDVPSIISGYMHLNNSGILNSLSK